MPGSTQKHTEQAAIIHQLRQKVHELEIDLEHAISQFDKITATRADSGWINRNEPKLDNK